MFMFFALCSIIVTLYFVQDMPNVLNSWKSTTCLWCCWVEEVTPFATLPDAGPTKLQLHSESKSPTNYLTTTTLNTLARTSSFISHHQTWAIRTPRSTLIKSSKHSFYSYLLSFIDYTVRTRIPNMYRLLIVHRCSVGDCWDFFVCHLVFLCTGSVF